MYHCKLVEMPSHTPSDVFALVPKATPEQMEFYKIVEDIKKKRRPDKMQLPNEDTKVKELGFWESIETQGQSVPDSCTNLIKEIKESINKLSTEKNVALTFPNNFKIIYYLPWASSIKLPFRKMTFLGQCLIN